jgi:polar amino acid transport system substrate-binding protein
VTRIAAAGTLACACALALGLFAPPSEAKGWEEIRTLGEITVCANPNALPYASDREETPGFQIEIARAIAQRLGVRLRPQWIVPRVRAGLVDCDLLMDTILVGGVQPPSLKLSVPYYRSGVSLAFAPGRDPVSSYAELKRGSRVGVLHNSLASLIVSRTPATMVPFGFEDDMLEAVAKGEVDAGAVSAAAAGYFNLRNPARRLTLVHAEDSQPELQWTVGVGMRRADDALVENINRALLALLADGTLAAIYARYGVTHRTP